jgi:hypothetical protein
MPMLIFSYVYAEHMHSENMHVSTEHTCSANYTYTVLSLHKVRLSACSTSEDFVKFSGQFIHLLGNCYHI